MELPKTLLLKMHNLLIKAHYLPIIWSKIVAMLNPNETEFILKGEVAEILGSNSSIKTKVICRPGSLIIEVPSVKNYHLGEQVILKGKFICESINHIKYNNTNH